MRPTTDVRLRRVLDQIREVSQDTATLPLVVGCWSQANLPESWYRTIAIVPALPPWLVFSGLIVNPPMIHAPLNLGHWGT